MSPEQGSPDAPTEDVVTMDKIVALSKPARLHLPVL